MPRNTYKLTETFDVIKGTSSAQNEVPGDYPLVVTARARKSSQKYQFDGEAVCVPLVSSTGHGNAAINRVHYQTGKFSVASILAALTPKSDEIDCKFLYYYLTALKDQILVPLMKGTSNVSLTVGKLKSLSIEVPSIHEQCNIVRRLDSIQANLQDRLSLLNEVERDTDAMLQNAFNAIIDDAEFRPLSKVAPLVRRPVEVELDGEYPELGVRSFGKGTFHKPTLTGADVGNKRLFEIHEGDLLFNIVFAWEGAIAVPSAADHCRVGSHRFLTCVPHPDIATAEFLRFYLLSAEGLHKVGEASPGGAGRNRTLGIKKAEQITVPIPSIEAQRRFDKLCAYVAEIRSIRASTAKDAEALIPAMLHEIFEKKDNASIATMSAQIGNAVPLPAAQSTAADTPFKEAVLVGTIIKAFHEEGGQPLGNFRLQKAVYFARRFIGERALEQEYLRKAAGPYNPSMRYSGGVKIALDKNWIAPVTGKYGPGHAPGSAIADAEEWIKKFEFAKPAAWVRNKFKFKSNDIWELLATVDYAMLTLEHGGKTPSAADVFGYISDDAEWHPKIEKLRLSEASIQNAMIELESLFVGMGDK